MSTPNRARARRRRRAEKRKAVRRQVEAAIARLKTLHPDPMRVFERQMREGFKFLVGFANDATRVLNELGAALSRAFAGVE